MGSSGVTDANPIKYMSASKAWCFEKDKTMFSHEDQARMSALARGCAGSHARGHSRGVRIGSLVVVRNVSDLSLWSHFRERSRVRAHVSPRCVVNVLRVAFESSFFKYESREF